MNHGVWVRLSFPGATDGNLLSQVAQLRKELIRKRALYVVLSPIESGIINICSRLRLHARSLLLGNTLAAICQKMTRWLVSPTWQRIFREGSRIAEQNISLAQVMGNTIAQEWAGDLRYIMLLGLNEVNDG